MKKVLWLNNNSTHMPGKVVLTWFYPKLEALFSAVDTRDLVVSLITLFNENWIPGLIHRRVAKRVKGDTVESVMALTLDPSFGEFLDWDLDLIGGPQVLRAPCMLGLPPFDDFGMLADTRTPERIIWEEGDRPDRQHGTLRIRGVEYGRIEPFSSFCRKVDINLCDEEIALGPKATNFEVRFYRLSERLHERTSRLSLEKTGRGSFRLKSSASIDFKER